MRLSLRFFRTGSEMSVGLVVVTVVLYRLFPRRGSGVPDPFLTHHEIEW